MSGYFEIPAHFTGDCASGDDTAEIAIRIGDDVLTRLADLNTERTRDFFRASAVTLGFWLADNWWRLRCEPIDDASLPSADWRLRHELAAASGGTLWPPLMIYSGGERITFAPSIGSRSVFGSLRYLEARVRTITAQQFEHGIDHYLNTVLEACTRAADAAALSELVAQLDTERREPGLSAWRRLEACLGYDADEAPAEVVEALLGMTEHVAPADLEEAAIASHGAAAARDLETAIEAAQASSLDLDFGLAEKINLSLVDTAYPSPWQLAEEAAAQVRARIGLNRGPINNKALGNMLLVKWTALKSATGTQRQLAYAARLQAQGSRDKIALQSITDFDRRFEVARLFGDAIWTCRSPFGLTSDAKSDRQKFQRAFAQSLLCPFRDVREFVSFENPKRAQIRAAAQEFEVHPHVVRNLLVYKGILPRETLEDQLEAA